MVKKQREMDQQLTQLAKSSVEKVETAKVIYKMMKQLKVEKK